MKNLMVLYFKMDKYQKLIADCKEEMKIYLPLEYCKKALALGLKSESGEYCDKEKCIPEFIVEDFMNEDNAKKLWGSEIRLKEHYIIGFHVIVYYLTGENFLGKRLKKLNIKTDNSLINLIKSKSNYLTINYSWVYIVKEALDHAINNNNMNTIDPCEQEIINFCEILKKKLLSKYRKGKEEHGNQWRNVDIPKEIGQEILDIINYHCMGLAQEYYEDDK